MNFFEELPERPIVTNKIDWWNVETIKVEAEQNSSFLLSAPIDLLEDKNYFFHLAYFLPISAIYEFFSPEVKEQSDVLHVVIPHLINHEHIHLLPNKLLSTPSFVFHLLIDKPFLYRFIDVSMKNDVDIHIKLLEIQKNKFYFDYINSAIYENGQFLTVIGKLITQEKIFFKNVTEYLPKELKSLLKDNDNSIGEVITAYGLKKKLDSALIIDDHIKKNPVIKL